MSIGNKLICRVIGTIRPLNKKLGKQLNIECVNVLEFLSNTTYVNNNNNNNSEQFASKHIVLSLPE